MKSVTRQLFFIVLLFVIVATKGTFKVHSHSGSWCDFKTKLGKVNIQVFEEGETEGKASFNMTLVDDEEGKYDAHCIIGGEEKKNHTEPEDLDHNEEEEEEQKEPLDNTDEPGKEGGSGKGKDLDSSDMISDTISDTISDIIPDTISDTNSDTNSDKNSDTNSDAPTTGPTTGGLRLLSKKNLKAKLIKKRKLEKKTVPGVCYFTPPSESYNLYYQKDSLVLSPETKDEVVIEDDFYVIAQKCLSAEKAEKMLDIHLSFRQLNKFEQKGSVITFYFYALTNQKYDKGFTIEIFVYLLLANGQKEKKERKATCVLEEATNPTPFFPVQADFKCTIDGLTEKYSSLVFHRSDAIAGVPKDEMLLNPVLTHLAILKGLLLDFSLPENKVKVPSMFSTKSIKDKDCKTQGTFTISGTIGGEIKEMKHVRIPLTYPSGAEAICKLPPSKAESEVEMQCKYGGEMEDQPIIIEQIIVKDGKEEIFTLAGIKSESSLTCINGEKKEAERKLNIKLSFRQVNFFKLLSGRITFKFFGLASQKIEAGNSIEIWVFLLLPGGVKDSKETKATCKLGQGVEPKKGHQIQADFECEIVDLDPKIQYLSFIISFSEFFSGLPKNKILLDPEETRKAIERGELLDYSLEENKNKVPVVFDPTSVSETTCLSNGEFKITGSVNEEIKEDLEFILPLAYPEDFESKCTLSKTTQLNSVEMLCIIGGEVSEQSLMFEQQVVREGLNELLSFNSIQSEPLSCSKGDITMEEESSDKSLSDKSLSDKSFSDKSLSDKSLSDKSSSDKSKLDDSASDEDYIKLADALALKEAEKKFKLTLSFRQLNKFEQVGNKIEFMFFGLTTAKIVKGAKIKMFVMLVIDGGEKEDKETEVECKLQADASPEGGQIVQADFKCATIKPLPKDTKFYTHKLSRCDFIADIPKQPVLLDPILTERAIERGDLLDYSLEENKKPEKIPALFNSQSINPDKCKAEGSFAIKGSLSKELENDLKFKVPLSYPAGIELTCNIAKGEKEVSCKLDREIEDNRVIMEQTTIRDGPEEVLLLGRFKTDDNVQCANAILLSSEEKAKVKISFRQVSHFEKNGRNGFSFFLASLVSQKLPVNHIIKMKMNVMIKGVKKEKEAECKLQSEVNPSEGNSTQGDFVCEGKVEEEEYKEINFTDTESVTVSADNEEIVGVSDIKDGQDSPIATDVAINETLNETLNETSNANEIANETYSELAKVVDYSLEENKELVPPTFEILSIGNFSECRKKSRFNIIGKFSQDISEELKFDLPLTFPSSKIKCRVDNATKDEEVEIECKVLKDFIKVKNFVIEQRTIKKRNKEVLFIKSNTLDLGSDKVCENYNEMRLKNAKTKRDAKFSFLQVRNFNPVNNIVGFFMAIVLKKEFKVIPTIQITIKVRITIRKSLRGLVEGEQSESVPVSCKASNNAGSAAGLDCKANSPTDGEPQGMSIDPDDTNSIAGVPENADPAKSGNEPDYSKPENLNSISNIPTVTINNVTGSECSSTGSYVIEGTYNKGELKNTENLVIPFSTVASSGLCKLTVKDGKKITLNCENKEEFDTNPIGFETTSIKDADGKLLFILDSYIQSEEFGCIISENSEPPVTRQNNLKSETTVPDDGKGPNNGPKNSTDDGDGKGVHKTLRKESSGGLSGGAIAAIIICAIVVVAIIGVVIGLAKTGVIFGSKPAVQNLNTSSSLNNFAYNPKPNEY